MDDGVATFLTFGALLLVGLAAEYGSRRLGLPSITILLVVGVLVGPEALDTLPATTDVWFPFVSTLALTMVGFLLGADSTRDHVRAAGRIDLLADDVLAIVIGQPWSASSSARSSPRPRSDAWARPTRPVPRRLDRRHNSRTVGMAGP